LSGGSFVQPSNIELLGSATLSELVRASFGERSFEQDSDMESCSVKCSDAGQLATPATTGEPGDLGFWNVNEEADCATAAEPSAALVRGGIQVGDTCPLSALLRR
jgi:hypothetical protein